MTTKIHLDGVIDEETLQLFKSELNASTGAVEVVINSYGGDFFAGAELYTLLKSHSGRVTVEIPVIAASCASVVAMAGDTVSMSPAAMLMIHNPWSIAIGDSGEMRAAAAMLDEIAESLILVYQQRTGLPRERLSEMLTAETWLNAKTAVELGFADEILYQ